MEAPNLQNTRICFAFFRVGFHSCDRMQWDLAETALIFRGEPSITESQGRGGECAALLDCVRNVMAHAQKPDFVFRRNGRVQLNGRGRQFSRLLAAEVWASALVMLDTPRSEVVWRVLATHSIRQFLLHFPSRASPCAITLRLDTNSFNFTLWCYQFWHAVFSGQRLPNFRRSV